MSGGDTGRTHDQGDPLYIPCASISCLLEVCFNLIKNSGEALVVGRGGVNRKEEGGEGMNTFKTIPQFCRTTAIYLLYRQVMRLLVIKLCTEVAIGLWLQQHELCCSNKTSKSKLNHATTGRFQKEDLFWFLLFCFLNDCDLIIIKLAKKQLVGFFLNITERRVQTRKVTQKRKIFALIEMLECFSRRDQVLWFISLLCHKLSPQHVTMVGPRLARGKTCSLQGKYSRYLNLSLNLRRHSNSSSGL